MEMQGLLEEETKAERAVVCFLGRDGVLSTFLSQRDSLMGTMLARWVGTQCPGVGIGKEQEWQVSLEVTGGQLPFFLQT